MVTDNHNVLKMPSVVQYNNDVKSSVALEKAGGGLKYNLHKNFYTKRDYKTNKVIALTNKEKFKVKGSAHVLYLPPESVTKVMYPGNPDHPFGYFVLLDAYGSFSKPTDMSAYQDLTTLNDSEEDQIVTKAGKATINTSYNGKVGKKEIQQSLVGNFNEFMKNELLQRLANGTYHTTFELSEDDIFYRIMLARSLSAQQTQVLFLPEQMVSYQAFECDENGNGISLIEKSKFWSTIRTVLTMAHYLNELDGCVKQKPFELKAILMIQTT